MKIKEKVERFIQFCRNKALSENTVRAYEQDLSDFEAWMLRAAAQEISKALIVDWVSDLRDRGYAPSTIKRRVACLKVMCLWLEDEDSNFESPFHKLRLPIRLPRRLPRHLTEREIVALLTTTSQARPCLADQTLALALNLMFTTGIRVGELCAIQMSDIDLQGQTVTINGKGKRQRLVFIVDDEIASQVTAYLTSRQEVFPQTKQLLVSASGAASTPDKIRRMLHKRTRALGLERKITPHMLRHSAATELLSSGVDIRLVQELLGHASISTTEIYTHVSTSQLKMAIRSANPRKDFI